MVSFGGDVEVGKVDYWYGVFDACLRGGLFEDGESLRWVNEHIGY